MKIKFTYKEKPRMFDIRTRNGFLFIPRIIDNEFRWLQRASWEERYQCVEGFGYKCWSGYECWVPVKWL